MPPSTPATARPQLFYAIGNQAFAILRPPARSTQRLSHHTLTMAEEAQQELTEHEAAIYDRQLRVWGVETQKRQKAGVVPPPVRRSHCRRRRRRRHLPPCAATIAVPSTIFS